MFAETVSLAKSQAVVPSASLHHLSNTEPLRVGFSGSRTRPFAATVWDATVPPPWELNETR
jgi:hypothetical protein